jgi:hypothetical protein
LLVQEVPPASPVVTLRLAPRRKKKGVKWNEDVIDNEHLDKKSSKRTCRFSPAATPPS